MVCNKEKRWSSLPVLGSLIFLLFAPGEAWGQARELLEPDVMLLIDSSGSMDWRDNTGRDEGIGAWEWARQACVANLFNQEARTSWQKLQDAFLGKFNQATYKCAVHYPAQRPSLYALRDETLSDFIPDNISEFDDVTYPHFHSLSCPEGMWQGESEGYDQCIDPNQLPTIVSDGISRCYTDDDNLYYDGERYWCLNLHPEADPRQNNGILDTFGSNIRFGAMTYDNLPKCWENCSSNRHATRWDYGHYRHWNCGGIDNTTGDSGMGNTCYDWNAGARGAYDGAVGGLVGIGNDAVSSNDEVADLLESMEPLFCSPLGALIDDAGYYFANDPMALPAGGETHGQDRYYRCRPKIALLITDGQPTSVFEFAAGTCNGGEDDLSEWDPINSTNASRINHESTGGPPFRNASTGEYLDDHVFDCPWRSSPEEASELFDVGARILQNVGISDPSNCTPPECWPLLLVVVGFNVPDVDCNVTPELCYWYSSSYTRCWAGIPDCTADPDAGPDDEMLCPMTPREFLNEVACQGWPYSPASTVSNSYGAGGTAYHETAIAPPWLEEFCEEGSELCNVLPEGHTERALFVDDVDDLSAILDLILVEMSSNVVTRTDIVAWNLPSITGFTNAAVAQYEFKSGYVATAGRPWKGVLTRVDKTCVANSTPVEHNVAEMIAAQGQSRTIYSYKDDPTYVDPSTNLTNWLNQTTAELKDLGEDQFDDCVFGVGEHIGAWTSSVCDGNHEVADLIVSETKSRGLADIFNSTPAVLGAPNDHISSASYQSFRINNASRSPYLFVATNDGVLHAIDIDEISGSGDTARAPERWGFMPNSLLKELMPLYPIPEVEMTHDASTGEVDGYTLNDTSIIDIYRHEFLLDGSPVARDVLLIRRADVYNSSEESIAWRTIVFGSSGRNARTLYALDVTESLLDPANHAPKLRYEIAPDHGMYGNNDPDAEGNYSLEELGQPVSKPAVAYVRQQIGQTGASSSYVVAAALVPGGYKTDANPNAPDPEQAGNTGVYVLRLADGQVIRYLDPKREADICDNGVGLIKDDTTGRYWDGAQMIGEPIVPHGTRSLKVTTHAFIGDDRGRIWLIDMYDEDPDDWCLSIYFDTLISWHYPYEDCADNGELTQCSIDNSCIWTDCCTRGDEDQLPCDDNLARNMQAPRALIIGAPAIAVNEQNQDVLIFGTGQYDELTNWNRNRIFSLTDEVTSEIINQKQVFKHQPVINWWIGDSVPSGTNDDFFGDIPSSASANKAFLAAIANSMRTIAGTHVSLDDYPVLSDGTGPQEFWNVGEKLIGRPVVFDQVTYFTTYIPLNDKANMDDACEEGASRVWALDYDTYDSENPNEIGKFKVQADDGTVENVPFHNYHNEVLSGVKVVKRPRCTGSDAGIFELLVQKANPNYEALGSDTPPANAIESMSIPISTRSDTSLVSVRFDSWSIVF